MSKVTQICISIERGGNVGRNSAMLAIKYGEKHGAKIITGQDIPTEPCECGATLYAVDIEYPDGIEFHSYELCPLCNRAYRLTYNYELMIDGKPIAPQPEDIYEEYVADMKAAGYESFTMPKHWFEAHQNAISFTIGEETAVPPSKRYTYDDEGSGLHVVDDRPTSDGNARADWLDQIEAEIEADKKANRIADMATKLDRLSARDFMSVAVMVELMRDAKPETTARALKMIENFTAGLDVYSGIDRL